MAALFACSPAVAATPTRSAAPSITFKHATLRIDDTAASLVYLSQFRSPANYGRFRSSAEEVRSTAQAATCWSSTPTTTASRGSGGRNYLSLA